MVLERDRVNSKAIFRIDPVEVILERHCFSSTHDLPVQTADQTA